MSLSSTSTLKAQLKGHLGPKANLYFATLNLFVTGQTSRTEFDDTIRAILDTPNLVQLHNALIISLFDATTHKRPPSPTELPRSKPPTRKRRRVLPYQGPAEDVDALSLRSARLKRWTLSIGKRERDRLKSFQAAPLDARPLMNDEVSAERGVVLLPERGEPPGSRLQVHLAATAGMPTVAHIAERMNLICAQNNLGAPSRAVPSLMNLACEAMLKQLLTHALTLTSTSQTISSITPSTNRASHATRTQPVLTTASFNTLFTVSPADLPNKSAAALRLGFMGEEDGQADSDRDIVLLKDREVRDQRWQILALLSERSTVREVLSGRAGGI
ncbi:transcriptional regulator of RNA polII, SAGA, subunit-domain-containing protein [Mycena pura]|uniref:Transcriptional regulator of RNA polII, SAGA, subunit-domain-containing protein n=1 Tax=Mycena pura TaxID=153505 RepID=A0AAD6VTV0_9AGAR|nr:transcriptional regulator of RNA polII, SAGA, subunit-domain-containing protein [Mycena pura]